MTTIVDGTTGITFPSTISGVSAVQQYSGRVLQVVFAYLSTGGSTTSTSLVTTGLFASITPTSSSSKILIQAAMPNETGSAGPITGFTVYRGATNLSPTAYMAQARNGSSYVDNVLSFNWLDSPATTSSTTYTLYINTSSSTTYWANNVNSTGSLVLMEIAA
jgi:hypothetical protein